MSDKNEQEKMLGEGSEPENNTTSEENIETNQNIEPVASFDNNTNASETTYPENDKNAVFFEKFEKSKKDFMKEKRKGKWSAKRSMMEKKRSLGFDARLREEEFVKKIWIYFAIAALVMLAYGSVVMGFLGDKFNGTTDNKWVFANYFSAMTKTSVIFSGIAISLIPLPYFYLLSAWFIGINNIHQNKAFVVTNIVILILSAILLLIVIPMSTYIFAETLGFRPIISTETPPAE